MSTKTRSQCMKTLDILFDYYERDKAEPGEIISWTKELMSDIKKLDPIWKIEKQQMIDQAKALLRNMGV